LTQRVHHWQPFTIPAALKGLRYERGSSGALVSFTADL
jgi:hypothetical protein